MSMLRLLHHHCVDFPSSPSVLHRFPGFCVFYTTVFSFAIIDHRFAAPPLLDCSSSRFYVNHLSTWNSCFVTLNDIHVRGVGLAVLAIQVVEQFGIPHLFDLPIRPTLSASGDSAIPEVVADSQGEVASGDSTTKSPLRTPVSAKGRRINGHSKNQEIRNTGCIEPEIGPKSHLLCPLAAAPSPATSRTTAGLLRRSISISLSFCPIDAHTQTELSLFSR
ncbi:hypothetical protein L2E82_24654 [Cichorium intybus]|uniref:Uncharacterized protein n=1 Tax=Cichorium intybus TaxID=13427 RepID=A0ACB9E0U3_CICIN|nr:hypothetical protein L2E82_24654 [Cichorium intybus]